jgi:hypothetical protein
MDSLIPIHTESFLSLTTAKPGGKCKFKNKIKNVVRAQLFCDLVVALETMDV